MIQAYKPLLVGTVAKGRHVNFDALARNETSMAQKARSSNIEGFHGYLFVGAVRLVEKCLRETSEQVNKMNKEMF